MLDLAGRDMPSESRATELSMRHGIGGRRFNHFSAEARVPTRAGWDGLAGRPLPDIRRVGARYGFWRWRWSRVAEASSGCDRRWRSHLRSDQGIRNQQ